MSFKKYIGLTAGASAFLLSACSQNSPQAMQNTASDVSAGQTELAAQFNELFETEQTLQGTFEETLADDPELETLADESSPVFENIDQRREYISSIEDLSSDLNSSAQNFSEYEGEELTTEEVHSLGDNLSQLNEQISEYAASYTENLDSQEAYFKEIGADDADFQLFIDGMDRVNAEQENLQEAALSINSKLSETEQQTTEFIQTIEEMQNQEEE